MLIKNIDYEDSSERFVIFDILNVLVRQFP